METDWRATARWPIASHLGWRSVVEIAAPTRHSAREFNVCTRIQWLLKLGQEVEIWCLGRYPSKSTMVGNPAGRLAKL